MMKRRIMKTAKVSVCTMPNRQIRDFNFNIEVSNGRMEHFERPLRPSSHEYLKNIGPIGTSIVEKLFEIDGIMEVYIHPYQIAVVIADDFFDWYGRKGVQKQVVAVFRTVLREYGYILHPQGELKTNRHKYQTADEKQIVEQADQ